MYLKSFDFCLLKFQVEEDPACGEVSSNVLGYASCDSVSVSTTRTPPVECDLVQAPDSSLNPPHLPSPVVPPQPVYFSYFDKSDNNLEEYYCRYVVNYEPKGSCDGRQESNTNVVIVFYLCVITVGTRIVTWRRRKD